MFEKCLYTKALRTTLDGSQISKDCSCGDRWGGGNYTLAYVWLAKNIEMYHFGHEWGRHGPEWAHIKRGRSHGLQEGF